MIMLYGLYMIWFGCTDAHLTSQELAPNRFPRSLIYCLRETQTRLQKIIVRVPQRNRNFKWGKLYCGLEGPNFINSWMIHLIICNLDEIVCWWTKNTMLLVINVIWCSEVSMTLCRAMIVDFLVGMMRVHWIHTSGHGDQLCFVVGGSLLEFGNTNFLALCDIRCHFLSLSHVPVSI